jgi:hypothetical protein
MPDTSITLLYSAKTAVYLVFAGACFWRAWQNHLILGHARKSLIVLGVTMLALGASVVYRIVARLETDLVASRALLNTPGFWAVEIVATVALVVLFFILQEPRHQ